MPCVCEQNVLVMEEVLRRSAHKDVFVIEEVLRRSVHMKKRRHPQHKASGNTNSPHEFDQLLRRACWERRSPWLAVQSSVQFVPPLCEEKERVQCCDKSMLLRDRQESPYSFALHITHTL